MKKKLQKYETMLWLLIKASVYLSLMIIFIFVFGKEFIGLRRLSRTLGVTVVTFCVAGFLFLSVYGKYDVGRRKSKPIINSLVLAVLFTDCVSYLVVMIMRINVPNVWTFRLANLGLLFMTFVIQTIVIIIDTYFGNWLFFKFHKPERCCVITSSQNSLDKLVYAMQKYKKQYEIVSILDYRSDLDFIKDKIQSVQTVFLYDVPANVRTEVMRWSYERKINVYFNLEIEDVMEMNAEHYILDDLYLLNKNVKALTMEQRIMKRLLDVCLSLVLGVVSAPFWIGGMIAIKLDDGGPVIFKQKRATINGKTFYIYKLRTMKLNSKNYSVTKDDDRITKVGKFLRRTRIDELPQLFNVLKGDMSFVGPRPEMIENVTSYEEEIPEFKYRLRMKAGLTGYAQISGKYNTTPKDKLLMDMMYIEQFSIWKDIQLILQTAIVLLKSDSTEAFEVGKNKNKYQFVPWEK